MSNATTLNRPTPRQQTNTTPKPPRIPHRTPEPIPEPIRDPALEPNPSPRSPAPLQARRHTSELTPTEQGALLEDYFDNSVELATIASNAGVRLFDLVQWLASPPIQAKLDLIKAADLERAQRIAAHHAAVAMQAMAFIARQSPDSDRSMETVRKAAAYVHRAAQPPKLHTRARHRTPSGGQPQSPTQDQTQSQCEPQARHDSAPSDATMERNRSGPVPSTPPNQEPQPEQPPIKPPLPSSPRLTTPPRIASSDPLPTQSDPSP